MTLRWSAPCAVLIATASACRSSDVINPDHCFILVAQLQPADPALHLGDTVTMRATFSQSVAPECLPADTTAAGLRWISSDPASIALDQFTGRLTGFVPAGRRSLDWLAGVDRCPADPSGPGLTHRPGTILSASL